MRLSLTYPATVLAVAGLGLLFFPQYMLQLLGSTEQYPMVILEFAGMFMCVLAVFVSKTILEQLTALYNWTIYLRLFMGICLVAFYQQSQNLLFLYVLIILLVGLILSAIGLIMDQKRSTI